LHLRLSSDQATHTLSLVCGDDDLDVCAGSSELEYSNVVRAGRGSGKKVMYTAFMRWNTLQVGEINLDRNCIFEVHPPFGDHQRVCKSQLQRDKRSTLCSYFGG
jgi:hypothetical protein